MNGKTLTQQTLTEYTKYLREEEKSKATVEKYLRDARHFLAFAEDREVTKALTMEYKSQLQEEYAAASANSMIASLKFLSAVRWLRELLCQAVQSPTENLLSRRKGIDT